MTPLGGGYERGTLHKMEDGGVPSHSCISLMNSHSMSDMLNGIWTVIVVMLVSDTVYVLLDSVLVLEEKEQFCVVTLLTGSVLAVKVVFPGEPIPSEGSLSV